MAYNTAWLGGTGLDDKVDPVRDALYNYDNAAYMARDERDKVLRKNDPNFYKTVRVSPMALTKMVQHARSGGSLEVMGLMQGFSDGTTIVVTDAFRLPVEGTETRVNAQDEANEYMVQYLSLCRENGRLENCVGWYHSHPGYGCWLSGIDVETQSLQQSYNEPWVAVVIDPDRTASAGKVEIGAFRTYPKDYAEEKRGGSGGGGGDRDVPQYKAEDFGAHASRYYPLDVEPFKGSLDAQLLGLLGNKYWAQTLSQNPLLANRDYATKHVRDVGYKLQDVAAGLQRSRAGVGGVGGAGGGGASALVSLSVSASSGGSTSMLGGPSSSVFKLHEALEKTQRTSKLLAARERAGLASSETKDKVFGGVAAGTAEGAAEGAAEATPQTEPSE